MPIFPSLKDISQSYDYIIVGGGTAGCVLARRLSEDKGVSVLVLERGQVLDGWASKVPLFSADFSSDGSRTRKTESLPIATLNNKTLTTVTGGVLGGSTRINQMLYLRGFPGEYNQWAADGNRGWSYDTLKPLFSKSEGAVDHKAGQDHGKTGPWKTRVHDEFYFPASPSIIQAAGSLGIPFTEDLNASDTPAVVCSQVRYTLDANGRRSSTYHAFLPSQVLKERGHRLDIRTGVAATKISFKSGKTGGLRADVVHIRLLSGSEEIRVSAKKEIILCAGALGTPQLLMLSGVGPREHLNSLGIKVLKDLPGVGHHLQDHFSVPLGYFVPMSHSLLRIESGMGFFKEFFKYIFSGKGLVLGPIPEIVIFAKSSLLEAGDSRTQATPLQTDAHVPANLPDIEIMPIAYDGTGTEFDKSKGAFSFLATLARPSSAGCISLKSTDPLDDPHIDLNFFSTDEDQTVMRKAMRLVSSLVRRLREQGYPIDDYRVPESYNDADLNAHIKKWGRTAYHYSSTCRMGSETGTFPGVVDEKLRVYGVEGLRIADASVLPDSPAAHLQAPTVIVAEKCAELLLSGSKK